MRSIARRIYLRVRNEIMTRSGLQPRGEYHWAKDGNRPDGGNARKVIVPNLVGSYHPTLVAWWERFGIGARCLLVSEPRKVALAMRGYYPSTEFVTVDLYPELMGSAEDDVPDAIWDVCLPAPARLLSYQFDSIICQALLEHVIDPTAALFNMLTLLGPGGHLYFMTHTPSFHKHQYPRDYVRFHHDYFEDLPRHLSAKWGLAVELCSLWSSEGVVCGAYRRTG